MRSKCGFAGVIRRDSLLRVIDDVLDFPKIESGTLELEYRPFELRACGEAALELVAAEAAEKELELGCLIGSDVPPEIMGDEIRLRQVLINLLSNTVKVTEEGRGGRLGAARRLRAARPPAAHGRTRHRDRYPRGANGETVPVLQPDRTSTSRRFGGTGLGLAISKRLGGLMGGTMRAESAVGQGSTFHFSFEAHEASAPPPPHAAGDQPQLHGKRLLVVDDNATNRQIVVRQTQSWGMLPRATGRPTEALAWVKRGDPFDAAILDMRMPEMDGVALAHGIRDQPVGRELPLVLLTSLARKESGRGASEFAVTLTKPLRASQLYDALVGILARRPDERVAPAAPAGAKPPTAAGPARSRPRILIAEDNAVNKKLALALLGRLGLEADVVEAGLEALEALEHESYDVVLMDVQIPELDGLEATRRNRRRRPSGRPRVIAMTANALQVDRDACFAAGMDDYLAKPIRLTQLSAALSNLKPLDEAKQDPPLDGTALDALREQFGDEDFVRHLIGTFLREAPRLLADLRSGSHEDVRRAAHTLRANATTLGAAKFRRMCGELEELAGEDRLGEAGSRVAHTEAEYARLDNALRAVP
jgi:CheY-like chemotaxis protein